MVTHPRFELGALKVPREMKSAIKGKFAQDLDWKLNRSKGSDGGTKIMNRRIDSRSTAGSSHTQTHDNAFKRKLLASTLNLPWLQAAVSKFKSGVVPSKICLRVEYQKGRGLHHLSNGYLLPSGTQRFRCYGFLQIDRLLKTIILDRLLRWRKNTFWGCSCRILPLSWIAKCWKNSPSFPLVTYTS
jgi:hypothetical protein